MARTVDKLRASLPGGNLGSYKMPGSSERLLEVLGITEERLLAVVREAKSDDDVAAWLHQHIDSSRRDPANALAERTIAVIGDLDALYERYPVAKRLGLTNLYDILEADDREIFATAN